MKIDRRPWYQIHIEELNKLKHEIDCQLTELAKDIEVIDPEIL